MLVLFDFRDKENNNELVVYLKDKLTNLSIKIGYNLIYLYSVCQIKFNKSIQFVSLPLINVYNNIYSFLIKYELIKELTTIFKLDKNGFIEYTLYYLTKDSKPNLINSAFYTSFPETYNKNGCFLVTHKDIKTNIINNVLYTSFPETFDYKISKVTFMSVELEYNGSLYSIILKNDTYNYYIVGNILNQQFLKYYLRNILKSNINDDIPFEYTLNIIDDNVNFITVKNTEYLIFNEDNYEIKQYDK
jgi:hypothetical protein